jgi:hypothetical protein
MRPDSRRPTAPTPAPASTPPWLDPSEKNSITCQLDVRSDWSYELCVVPHWDPSAALIERFSAPTPALLRQAEVTQCLREQGWVVIAHGAGLGMHTAA